MASKHKKNKPSKVNDSKTHEVTPIESEDLKKILIIGTAGVWKTSFILRYLKDIGKNNRISQGQEEGTTACTFIKFNQNFCIVDTPGINPENHLELSNSFCRMKKVLGILWFVPFNNARNTQRKLERMIITYLKSCHPKEVRVVVVYAQGEIMTKIDSFDYVSYPNVDSTNEISEVIDTWIEMESSDPEDIARLFTDLTSVKAELERVTKVNQECNAEIKGLILQNNSSLTTVENLKKEIKAKEEALRLATIDLTKETIENKTNSTRASILETANNTLEIHLGHLNGAMVSLNSASRELEKLETDIDCWHNYKKENLKTFKVNFTILKDSIDLMNNVKNKQKN